MPRTSAFTPCGVLRLSGKPSPGKLFYTQLKQLYSTSQDAGQPPFDFTVGTHLEASIYARARALARLLMLQNRAGDQANPLKAYEQIPLLEQDNYVVPGPNDTYVTRQKAIAAAVALPAPNRLGDVRQGLANLLGANFIDYLPAPGGHQTNPAPVIGASTGTGHFADVRQPIKFLQLVDPVLTTGSTSYCAYQNLDTTITPSTLVPGELVTVQGENSQLIEVVQVTGAWFSPPPAANGSATTLSPPSGTPTWTATTSFSVGQLVAPATPNGFWFQCTASGITAASEPAWPSLFGVQVTDGSVTWVAIGASTVFSAVFQNAHDAGASVLSGNFPFWWSTQRFSWIVVANAASVDPEQRRKVDLFMRRTVRGVSTWLIVAGTPVPGGPTYTVGPLSAGAGMGTSPLSAFTESP